MDVTVSVSTRRHEGAATALVTGNFDLAAAKVAAPGDWPGYHRPGSG
jgi:hypothetical protein